MMDDEKGVKQTQAEHEVDVYRDLRAYVAVHGLRVFTWKVEKDVLNIQIKFLRRLIELFCLVLKTFAGLRKSSTDS